MPDMPARQCGSCYYSRQMAGQLCCVRNPPMPDPVTAQARWPIVQPTDRCGRHRPTRANDDSPLPRPLPPPNRESQIPNHESDASAPNHQSSIINHQFPASTSIINNQSSIINPFPSHRPIRRLLQDPADPGQVRQGRSGGLRLALAVPLVLQDERRRCYAVRNVQTRGRSKRIYMHRLIMNTPDHLVCDHINHDGLDNRRRNCRNCTTAQNNANRRKSPTPSSQYLGVSYDKRRHKWVAHIKDHGKERYLGSYELEADAARAYDRAAIAIHGIYAQLNFPEEYPQGP